MSVSVIIPCFNGERYLRVAIDSVLAQTQPPEEIIVVDDGSTDNSAAIASSFGQGVRVLSQENRGLAGARNSGVSAARGDYLLFLDADDLLERRALELLTASVENVPSGVAVMSCAFFETDPSTPFRVERPGTTTFFPEIIRRNIGAVHTWLVPREVLQRAGGFAVDVKIFEDWECWCRVALLDPPLVMLDYVGALYRRHPESMMAGAIRAVTDGVLRGHLRVMQALCDGIIAQPALLEQHGEVLFWSAWTAFHRARSRGSQWPELRAVGAALEKIARGGPPAIRRSRFARLIRLLGIRWAESCRSRLSSAETWRGDAVALPSWAVQQAG